MATFCLSLHARYACRHAGACCSAPWAVRADDHVVRFVRSARIEPAGRSGALFVNQPHRDEAEPQPSVAKREDGVCVFREGRRCTLQVKGGPSALPIGCRHYPRVARIDHRGVALSLSHYCPTAASLLVCADPIRVVAAGTPVALSEPIEGLDAREALPPLLHPAMLMDVDGYAAWEEATVRLFSCARTPAEALAQVAAVTDRLRAWTPGAGTLKEVVVRVFGSDAGDVAATPAWTRQGLALLGPLNHGVLSLDAPGDPDTSWQAAVPPEHAAVHRVVSNYLAARTFGNWIAYQGSGLRTVVTWLHACYDVVRLLIGRTAGARGGPVSIPDAIEAIRQTDYLMLHTVDSQQFARAAVGIEG